MSIFTTHQHQTSAEHAEKRRSKLRHDLLIGAALSALALTAAPILAQETEAPGEGGQMLELIPGTPTMEEMQGELMEEIREGESEQEEVTIPDEEQVLEPAPNGPGCDVTPASAAVGADVAETYFGPPPSSVNPSLVGPLELLTAGDIDRQNLTVELPLYRGEIEDGRNVFYIVTDTTDEGNAQGLGINFSAKLAFADIGRGVRNATLQSDGLLVFEEGTVDFSPERQVEAGGEGDDAFPPSVAEPGAVGDENYSPLVNISNAGGHVYNMPIIAFDVEAGDIDAPDGGVDHSLVHDRVLAIDIFDNPVEGSTGTVTLELVPGFSFGKPILYLTMEASEPDVAALEGTTFSPGLQDIPTGFDDSLFGPAERLFTFTNGASGCDNPQRQGQSAALNDGETPFNILGGIPTVATDYSPIWDVNVGEWTQEAIDAGFRSRLNDEFQNLTFVQNGFVTGPGGADYGSAGFVVNCPIVFRFL